jgi:hypothetical protein
MPALLTERDALAARVAVLEDALREHLEWIYKAALDEDWERDQAWNFVAQHAHAALVALAPPKPEGHE